MEENNQKEQFYRWNEVKSGLHFVKTCRDIKDGDVWWCSTGQNIGVEINGKHDLFMRPVLVLKKLSKQGFLGVPLTTQPHVGSWYVPFDFKDKHQNAALAQIRVFSVYRLGRKWVRYRTPTLS